VTLAAPNLDDRRFQDLVDDAKRLVQQRCPEWTDHNVSDPGVTLIEAFATMVDQLLYRLNRVPERNYVRFLDLLGLRPFPSTAARAEVTFWLSAPQQATVTVPAGTELATVRTEVEEAVVFATLAPLAIVSCELAALAAARPGQDAVPLDVALAEAGGVPCFGAPPAVGDTFLVGLSEPAPSCAVTVRMECGSEGVGVDPRFPPLTWEAWDGRGWVPCELDRDGTGGLNKSGDVVLHVPASHQAAVLAGGRAGWLRCRVLETVPGQHAYRASPRLRAVSCFVIGGSTEAVHAEVVRGEVVGSSAGLPGQRFGLARRPVVPGDSPPVLEVSGADGWEQWAAVETFAGCRADEPVFVFDHAAGEVLLAPAVREPDGGLRQYGRVPPKSARLRLVEYRVGGGRRGNVATGALRVLKSSVPYLAAVSNRRPAAGGVDAEDVANAKARGPLLLRTRDRAVTAEDYEELARQAAPQVARVRCVPAAASPAGGADPAGTAGTGSAAGTVRVLVVPAVVGDGSGRLRFEQLQPDDEVLATIAGYLDQRRVVGARLVVEPPYYRGVTVVAALTARPGVDHERLRQDALTELFRYFHPVLGGPTGDGWPFGRPVQAGDVFAVLQRLAGCELVDDVRLFPADPVTGHRGDAVQRLEVPPNGLTFSYEHQVRVQP
jgi:predicted phage baseplate assembly protein